MLRVEALNAGYGDVEVLSNVDIEVRPGEVVAILGRNGSGKSTLLKSIAGIITPFSGGVSLNGQTIQSCPVHIRARSGLVYVPQGRRLFSTLTVRENIEIGLLSRNVAIDAALAKVWRLFPVLHDLSSRSASTLSGGQQQLVALAQAFVLEPRLLLLDEPSLGLQDPRVVQEVYHYIVRLATLGMAILLVEQHVAVAIQASHRFYLLDRGRMVRTGVSSEFDISSFHKDFLCPGPAAAWQHP